MKSAILLTLAALLLIPAALTLAEAPAAEQVLPAADSPVVAPPEAAEAPAGDEGEADLDLELLDQPEFQRRIRECTEQEAASISCSLDCCLYISNMPRCFC